MIFKIFPDIIYFEMHLCVSPCFCSGSTFHVHVAVENIHVHNALLNVENLLPSIVSPLHVECHCQPPYDFVISVSFYQ